LVTNTIYYYTELFYSRESLNIKSLVFCKSHSVFLSSRSHALYKHVMVTTTLRVYYNMRWAQTTVRFVGKNIESNNFVLHWPVHYINRIRKRVRRSFYTSALISYQAFHRLFFLLAISLWQYYTVGRTSCMQVCVLYYL